MSSNNTHEFVPIPAWIRGSQHRAHVPDKMDPLTNFFKHFDSIDTDGVVTRDEFLNYYKNLSTSIDNDDYFELMPADAKIWQMSKTWNGVVGQLLTYNVKAYNVSVAQSGVLFHASHNLSAFCGDPDSNWGGGHITCVSCQNYELYN